MLLESMLMVHSTLPTESSLTITWSRMRSQVPSAADPQAFVGGLPRAVAVGQIPPWRTGAQFPQDRVDHLAMVTPPTTGRGLTQPMPQSGVLAQRIFGLDVRGLLPLGLRFSAAPGRRVGSGLGCQRLGRVRAAVAHPLAGDVGRDRFAAAGVPGDPRLRPDDHGRGMNFYRRRNGRVTDVWTQFDAAAMMQQLGAIPA
jgi:hypothetical protein